MRARGLHLTLAGGDGPAGLLLVQPCPLKLRFRLRAPALQRRKLPAARLAVAGQTLLVAADAVHVVLGVLQGEHGVRQRLLRALAPAAGLVQRLGERLGAGVELVRVALLLRALGLDAPELPGDLGQALVKLLNGRAHGVQPHGVRLAVGLRGLEPLGVARDGDLLLMQLVLRALPPLLFARAAALHLGDALLGRLGAPRHFLQLRGQLLHLALAAQQVLRLLLDAAAGHAAAGVHHIALQRHQPEGMPARAHDGDAAVQVPGHHRASQQALHHAAVQRVIAAQLAGHADAAGHGEHLALARGERAAAHGAQRQKGRPAQPVLAQVVDQGLRVLLGFRHDVLHRGAQGHIHGRLVLAGHLQKHGHHVMHALEAGAPGIGERVSDRVLVALVAVLKLLEGPQARIHGAGALQILLHLLLKGEDVRKKLPGALLEALIAGLQPVQALLLGAEVFLRLCKRRRKRLLACLFLLKLPRDLGAARVHLLLHGALARLGGLHAVHAVEALHHVRLVRAEIVLQLLSARGGLGMRGLARLQRLPGL